MPNNFQSIVGGIFRGISSNKSSAGLNQTNTQNDTNPLTYQWIGESTGGTAYPINREQTQNPALPFAKGSAGTNIPYAPPVLTDIPTLLNQGSPGTDVSLRTSAGSVGSQTSIPPGMAPIANAVGNGYGMSPQNADHFKVYFANQIGLSNQLPRASAKTTGLAIADQQHENVAGSSDSWKSAYQTFSAMQKGYSPMGSIARW
jgi:hypothetical protein